MTEFSRRILGAVFILAAGVLLPTFEPQAFITTHPGQASADDSTSEKDAFEAAKELGTADAWKAFLANYTTGFHADLARAYLKKLEAQPTVNTSPAAADDYPVVAGSWGGIVRDGPGQSYRKVASLDEGEQVTLMGRSDVIENGFPWFKIAYGGGEIGYQWGGILCSAGAERPDLFKTCPSMKPHTPSTTTSPRNNGCTGGRVLVDGKCMTASAAMSYCGPGYRPQGGKCVLRSPPSQKKATKVACPKGLVWNAQEGCHEDD